MEIVERAVFRVTRDADFEVSDEADDLLEAVELELRRRRFGDVVRLEVSGSVSSRMLARLTDGLGAGDDQVYPIRGPWTSPTFRRSPRSTGPTSRTSSGALHAGRLAPGAATTSSPRSGGDVLVHHPYDSFDDLRAIVREAARDPQCSGSRRPCTGRATTHRSALIEVAEEAAVCASSS